MSKPIPQNLPKEILIYRVEEVDGHPIYAVALNVNDIPEDADGDTVGIYTINQKMIFHVRRELK